MYRLVGVMRFRTTLWIDDLNIVGRIAAGERTRIIVKGGIRGSSSNTLGIVGR